MRLPVDYQYRVDSGHSDAAEALFVERALLYVETEVYNTEFPPLEGMKYVPIDTSADEGAKHTAYKQYTRSGIAKICSERGNDLPTSNVFVKEFNHAFVRLGISYQYTLDDMLAAMFASRNGGPSVNIDLELAMGARLGIDRGLDVIAALGTQTSANIPGLSQGVGPDIGLLGLLNQTNASTYTPALGAIGSLLWTSKTPDEKIADLTGQYAAMVAGTYKVFEPTAFLLPITQYLQAKGQRMGDGSDETVTSFFQKIYPGVSLDSWQYCQAAGSGGTDRCVAYRNEKRYVRHMISSLFRQMPAEFRHLTFMVLCLAKTAGVITPYPLSISYMDGI
jgi:hypothetical protein